MFLIYVLCYFYCVKLILRTLIVRTNYRVANIITSHTRAAVFLFFTFTDLETDLGAKELARAMDLNWLLYIWNCSFILP
jgi:hypothetical protein